jgi:xanthine dehydrogenase accessory factor
MSAVLDALDAWSARGDAIALATVVETKKSAPQPAGTKMAVNARGDVVGAVSGGCVEGAVVEVAESVIRGAESRLLHYGIADSDAWDVGLPCGGEISVWVEPYEHSGLQAQFSEHAINGTRAAVVTAVAGCPARGAKLLVTPDHGPAGTLGDPVLDAGALELAREAMWAERSELRGYGEAALFIDVSAPRPRLIVVGAVDFAAQLCAVAALADWRAFVVDPRGRFATRSASPPPNA